MAGYLDWWQETFYGPYGGIEFFTADFQDFLSAEEMDYLAALVAAPFPATLNFSKNFGRMPLN